MHLEKAGMPAISGPKALAIRFSARYTHSGEYCKQPDCIRQVEDALKELTGQSWAIRVDLETAAEGDENPGAQPGAGVSKRQRREELMKVALLQRAEEVLGARLQDFHPDFGANLFTPDATDSTET